MTIFRKIWAAWGVLLFLVMMTISLPIVILMFLIFPENGRRYATFYLHQIFTRVFFTLILVKINVEGLEKLDLKTSYVLVGNHRTALDFIICGLAFPAKFRFLAKQELLKIPIFGFIVRKMCLIVDRRNAMSRARSVVELKNELARGWSVFIYPEGQRNRSDEPLGPFFDGAFRLAIQMNAPLAVLTTTNIQSISNSVKSVDLSPGIVCVVWSEPIDTTGMTAAEIPELTARVRTLMLENLQN